MFKAPPGPPAAARPGPAIAGRAGSDSGLGGLVDRHGWRLFAVAVLAVLTIVALFRPSGAHPAPEVQAEVSSTTAPAGETPPAPVTTVAPAPTTTVAPAASRPIRVKPHRAANPCRRNRRSTFVLVDIARQRVSMCEGSRQVYGSVATTGAVKLDRATPTGTWTVAGKQADRYLSGSDYNVFVKYWVPFDGNVGFHDASWQRMPFGAAGYTSLGSHGCVHLPTPAMKWLYHWIKPGKTTVTVAD